MSGHSKWASIKRQKGAADVKRGAVFSRLSKAIILAAKSDPNPESNYTLKMAVDQARAGNMPKENIERAIAKAKGGGEGTNIEEIMFEGYGPAGVAFLVQTTTDNRNRITSEIRHIFKESGGKMAESGSVSFMFSQKGLVVCQSDNPETTEMQAIEAGADDIEAVDDHVYIYTGPKELMTVKHNLETAGEKIVEASLVWEPNSTMAVDQETLDKLIRLSEELEDNDDVVKIASNFELAQ